MKKLISIFVCLLFCYNCYSQQTNDVIVTLKNGVTISGSIKEFIPTSHLDIIVAGKDVHLEMTEVLNVKGISANVEESSSSTDSSKLPKDTIVNIGGIDVKFVLVEGADFQYGYNGPGSLSFDSEPIINVSIPSFYISENLISVDIVNAVFGDSVLTTKPMKTFHNNEIKEAYGIALLNFLEKKDKFGDKLKYSYFKRKIIDNKNPTIKTFLSKVNSNKDIKLTIPTEVQWYGIAAKKFIGYENVNMLLPSEIVMGIFLDPTSGNNPRGEYYTLRGTTTDPKEEYNRLFDRRAVLVYSSEKQYNLYMGLRGGTTCGPFHLVFNP